MSRRSRTALATLPFSPCRAQLRAVLGLALGPSPRPIRRLQRLSLSPLSFWGLEAPVCHQAGMGQYLATPNTEKETVHGSHERLKYGISAQQGWRKNMVR